MRFSPVGFLIGTAALCAPTLVSSAPDQEPRVVLDSAANDIREAAARAAVIAENDDTQDEGDNVVDLEKAAHEREHRQAKKNKLSTKTAHYEFRKAMRELMSTAIEVKSLEALLDRLD